MSGYPEIFLTPLHQECFVRIVLMTLENDRVAQLKPLYRSLPYSENSVRAYLRSLSNGSWIRFERSAGGDGRTVGFSIEPRFKALREEFFNCLDRIDASRPAPKDPAWLVSHDASEHAASLDKGASGARYRP